ncbi:TonB-dependent receptor [Seonamhaeicola sp.]|uniref:TonB-dependent receptor n=1 Tax=Seonamhaeicola sp. TaxID=1912245 RepID=UPI00261ADBDD|nr:TonB-dependent receptor [Seonamhaeicola sp.]
MKKLHERKGAYWPFLKFDLKMKLTVLFVFASFFSMLASNGYSQAITLDVENTTVRKVIDKIEVTSKYTFVYNTRFVDLNRRVSITVEDVPIETVLSKLFDGTKTSYELLNTQIFLKERKVPEEKSKSEPSNTPIQGHDIIGTIKDTNGQALPGANIIEKGTSNGTQTDFDGNYSLSLSDPEATIIVSFIGFLTQEVAVNGQTNIDVILQEDAAKLDEVVLVGYGTQKVTNLTGAVAVITEEALEDRAANNVSNLLAGTGSGLTITSPGGSPGNDNSSISIRGVTTFGGSNEPLIIVDGIESTLDNIDPNDIESMSVLKDASASAIYGVRGGNGVIVIKTKRGKKGQLTMNFNTSVGFQEFTYLPKFGSSFDYATLRNEALINDGVVPEFDAAQLQGYQNGTLPNEDWLGAVTSEAGATHRYHFSLSGGTEKFNYNASLGHLDTDGVIPNTNYKRYNLRLNLDQQVNDKLNIAYNLALSRGNTKEPSISANSVFFMAYRGLPTIPIQNADGNYVAINEEYNAVAQARFEGEKMLKRDDIIGSIKASYEIVNGLTFTNISGITQRYEDVNNWQKYLELYRVTGEFSRASVPGVKTESYTRQDINIQNFLNYEGTFGKHNVKALLGHHSIQSEGKRKLVSIDGLPENNSSDEIALGDPETLIATSGIEENAIESYFGRINYNFDEKYLIEASFRRDATSRFAPENRSEFFPSFSVGWNLGNEAFFKVDAINTLKLRGSWGQLGNQEITNLAFAPVYVRGRDLWLGGITQSSLIEGSSNPDLTWETITKTNIGLDASLFNYKLNVTADYFIEDREDILALEQLPGTLGAEAPLANVGDSNAEGIEANITYKGTIGNDFRFSTNFNFTYFTKIPTVSGLSENAEIPGRSNGDPISNLFGYETLGLFQSDAEIAAAPDQSFFGGTPVPGDIRYVDLNGDGIVDENDRTSLGSYSPQLLYGFSLNANYKGFDFSALFQGAGKVNTFFDVMAAHPFVRDGKVQERHLDRWTPTNTDASYPILHAVNNGRNENFVNSFFIYNAAYLRLKNVQFGYSLPSSVTDKIGVDKLRIYFSGENLLTFVNSKYPEGFDPESLSTFANNAAFNNTDPAPLNAANTGFIYPQTKTYTFGVNVAF